MNTCDGLGWDEAWRGIDLDGMKRGMEMSYEV